MKLLLVEVDRDVAYFKGLSRHENPFSLIVSALETACLVKLSY
jgi:hypothetical protein